MRMHSSLLGLGYTAADLAMTTDPAMLAKLTLQEQINSGQISEVQATANAGAPINPCGNPEFAIAHPDYPNFNVDPKSCYNLQPGPTSGTLAMRVPPITQQQVQALSTAPPVNAGSAPAPTPPAGGGSTSSSSTSTGFDLSTWLKATSIGSIPNWALVLAGGGLGFFLYSRAGR